MSSTFWKSRRVLVTGHTGFKGAWLSLWLRQLGAEICGISLDPPSEPNLFDLARVGQDVLDLRIDIRDAARLTPAFLEFQPEVVFHLAAQALVRPSYADPLSTFSTNVLGTAVVLDALRRCESARAAVIVTSDKCYENEERDHAFRESDALGGHDPYSASKACAEIVTGSFRRSFLADGPLAVATVRAGNVIGGGDWAQDRLLPDLVRAFLRGVPAPIRSPRAVRPWQHVLEPVGACIELAVRLAEQGQEFAEAWNVGPDPSGARTVREVADMAVAAWGQGARWCADSSVKPHEAGLLSLDASKVHRRLGWSSRWSLEEAIRATVEWYRVYASGHDVRVATLSQIKDYGGIE